MSDTTQTQTGGLFTNPNQEPVPTSETSIVPETTQQPSPSVFQSSESVTVSPEEGANIASVQPIQEIISQPIVEAVQPVAVQPIVEAVQPIVEMTQPEPTISIPAIDPSPIAPQVTEQISAQTEPFVDTTVPEIKSHVDDVASLGALGEFAGINLGSLIQSASSSAVSTSAAQPTVSPEGSKMKKMVLIAMSVVGLLLLVGAGVWMMSVMDPLSGQDNSSAGLTGTLESGDIVSGNQGDSPILSGTELTGTIDSGVENSGLSGSGNEIDTGIDLGGTNNAALVDNKQIAESINEKMKAAYEVAKTAKAASNVEAAKKALLAYGMMKKMLTKLENGEYTNNDQAFTELAEYQSQVDTAAQLMNGN